MIDTKKEDTDFPYPDKEHEKVQRLLDFMFVEHEPQFDLNDYHVKAEDKMRREKI